MGRTLNSVITARNLSKGLGLELVGDPHAPIHRVDSGGAAGVGSLCFAKNAQWATMISSAAVVIVSGENLFERDGASLISEQPRLDFARALALIEQDVGFVWSSDEPQVHPTARIGSNVVLGRGVRVGAGTKIYHNVVVGDEVVIGERCLIKSGAVIGEEGFGFERDISGKAIRLPHIGTVVIGDDVEIGSLTTVCRGTMGDTVLRNGCKIDDHVHIAHNIDVGEDAFVIACAEVSGGVTIGARAWIAPNASILNQLSIGSDAVVGLGAVVTKSVPDGVIVVGNPAKPISRK